MAYLYWYNPWTEYADWYLQLHCKAIVEEFFRQAEFLQEMKMTPTEIVLLTAIAMFISSEYSQP